MENNKKDRAFYEECDCLNYLDNGVPFIEKCMVISNVTVGPRLYVIRLQAPLIASNVQPGQFVHVLVSNKADSILRRPFSVFNAVSDEGIIEILYQVVGGGTQALSSLEHGALLDVLGPLGRGWKPSHDMQTACLVGGGVGAAPLFMLAKQLLSRNVALDAIIGAQTVNALVLKKAYDTLDYTTICYATDDGSYGYAGFCTGPFNDALQSGKKYDYVAVCGPLPLMKLIAEPALTSGCSCEVSMERNMACGIGACLGCTVSTINGNKRSCADGPVFSAEEVIWQ